MKSRRNFITKTGIATVGLLALKPFKGIASSSLAGKLGFNNSNKLVLVHTSPNGRYAGYAEKKIASFKNSSNNMLLLKHDAKAEATELQHEILYRGNLKTGLIKIAENNSIKSVNDLAASLKNENNCDMIICLSSLGYKKDNGKDDVSLAEKSSHIDFIIGHHSTNHTPFPVVARNSTRGEVIIHHAAENGFGLGNIEVEFDYATKGKKSISINNLLDRLTDKA